MKKKAVQQLRNITASKVLAVLFLLFVMFVGMAGIPQLLINSRNAVIKRQSVSEYIATVNEQYEGMLATEKDQPLLQNKGTYINLNGLIARVLGQNEMNQRYKLKNGHLFYHLDPLGDEFLEAGWANMLSLHNRQREKGKDFLFVMAPWQLYQQEELIPIGHKETANEDGDCLIAMLEESGVSCFDLRIAMEKEGITNSDAFFFTDHHWKPETGFWAYGKTIEKLAQLGIISPVDTRYTSPENFNFTIYKDAFLGSSGKRTGIYYAGVDDFCIITPKFETKIYLDNEWIHNKDYGSFAEKALRTDAVEICVKKDYFNENQYDIYGWGNTPHNRWRNENAPEEKKVMLIGDSFANVSFSFMSLYFSSIEEIDMRYFKEDFVTLYDDYDPDLVIVMINPSSFDNNNLQYSFFSESNT